MGTEPWLAASDEAARARFPSAIPCAVSTSSSAATPGFATSTRLEDDKGCDGPRPFFISCQISTPSDGPGTAGGGSVGIGTRLTPALRSPSSAQRNGLPFQQRDPVDRRPPRVRREVHHPVFQLTGNVYLDVAGLLPPGALGRFNPYVLAGMGVAFNITGNVTETISVPAPRGFALNVDVDIIGRWPGAR